MKLQQYFKNILSQKTQTILLSAVKEDIPILGMSSQELENIEKQKIAAFIDNELKNL